MKRLVEQDYIDAAKLLKCEVALVKALQEVETSGPGFNKDGSVVILFEGHWFYKLTKGKYGLTNYSYPGWTRAYYNMDQHKRLQAAVEKDRDAALQSASWGAFQVMGFNYKKAGFKTIQEFINAMHKGEREQLLASCNFIISSGLDDELREKKFALFAYGYNGSGYAQNNYDVKLERAYNKYKR